ncbi:MAG: cyclic nucleotide-binding domain-containing protein [Pseudomonadota bacterium]
MEYLTTSYDMLFPGGLWATGSFVHLAMAGYVAGFVLTNQFALRFLILASSFAYIAYYYLHPAEPLWGAIAGTILIIAATIIGLVRLCYDRVWIALPKAHRPIFYAMPGLKPGEFRRLMRLGEIKEAKKGDVLTNQGALNDAVFFLVSATASGCKDDTRFTIPPKHFVGEVGFVLEAPASATVQLEAGGTYISWDAEKLHAALDANDGLERAFQALLSRDMANKVSFGVPIDQSRPFGNDGRPKTLAAVA